MISLNLFHDLKKKFPECTQIANSNKDLLWDVADNSINYCSNDLKKLPDVVQVTYERFTEFEKDPLKSSL